MINWKTLAQLGLLAGSVALLSACGASTWCEDCEDEDEDVVYIEVEKKGDRIEVEVEERFEEAEDDYKR